MRGDVIKFNCSDPKSRTNAKRQTLCVILNKKNMSKEKDKGCVPIIVIIICIIIALLVFGPLIENIGFLAYPLIVGGGLGLAKLTEPLWFNDKD